MKIIPPAPSNIFPYKETLKFINELYKEEVNNDFDDCCVQGYEIVMELGKVQSMKAVYNKIKVTPIDQKPIYWPILPYVYDLTGQDNINVRKKLAELLN